MYYEGNTYLQTPSYGSLDKSKILQVIYLSIQTGLTRRHFPDKHLSEVSSQFCRESQSPVIIAAPWQ